RGWSSAPLVHQRRLSTASRRNSPSPGSAMDERPTSGTRTAISPSCAAAELAAMRATLALILTALVMACAGPGPAGERVSQPGGEPPRRKAITISLEGEISALATELDASGVTGLSRYLHDFLHNYLTIRGDND